MLKKLRSQQGFGLMLMVILTAVTGILLLSSTRVFQNRARQTQLRIDQVKARALAQAGVMQGIWNWYTNNTTVEIARRWDQTTTTIAGTNTLYKVAMDSAAADLQSNFAYYVPGIAFVKQVGVTPLTNNANSNIHVLTVSAGNTVPVGDMLVIAFAMDGGGGAWVGGTGPPNPCGVIDSVGNTYIRDAVKVGPGADSNVSPKVVIWHTVVTAALANPNTITIDWTTNTTAEAVSVFHISGVDSAEPLIASQVAASGTLPGNVINSGNITTTFPNAILVGAVAVEGATAETFTAGSNFLITPPNEAGVGVGVAGITINPEYRIVSATGVYSASGTNSVNTDWSAAITSFYPSARWFNSGAGWRLRQWQVYNINNGGGLTLTQMKVSWSPTNAALLNNIFLNNASKWPGGGGVASGTTVNITDTVLANGGAWQGANTYLQWDVAPPDPIAVTVQYIWSGDTATSDSKSNEVVLWNGAQSGAGMPTKRIFDVTSTGQVNQTLAGAFKVLKTVKATVSGAPGRSALEIVDWDEGEKNIP